MKFKRNLCAPVIAAAISACTFQKGLEQTAIDYNRVADRVDKEILLLNVARAARREGITYTGVSEMRGNFTINAEAGFSIPFGGDALFSYGFTPKGFYRTNPSITIKPLGTKEFQNSIARDIDAATFRLFWERGWPKEVLLHLLVEKIVLTTTADVDPGEPCPDPKSGWASTWLATPGSSGKSHTCVIENDPNDLDAFQDFQRILQKAELRPYLHKDPGNEVGPTVLEEHLSRLLLVAKSHDGKLVLHKVSSEDTKENRSKDTKDPDRYVLKTPSRTEVRFSTAKDFSIGPANPNKGIPEAEKKARSFYQLLPSSIDGVNKNDKKKENPKDTWAYRLRSAEGIIYYMGELVRAQQTKDGRMLVTYLQIYDPDKECTEHRTNSNGNEAFVDTIVEADAKLDPCLVPLFVAWTGQDAAEIAIEHKGQRYFVPETEAKKKGRAGQSLLVMALVRQLFNLSTSREDLPSTQSVVVTGGGS